MKYLQEYMEAGQTKAIDKAGAFFAFSDKQFEEQKKEGIKYVNTIGGMICPKENVDILMEELDTVYRKGIEQDIEENGLNAIVRRELNNHEAYYTGDIGSTVDALSDYPVNADDIVRVFRNKNTIL